jgi:hypothetical protein
MIFRRKSKAELEDEDLQLDVESTDPAPELGELEGSRPSGPWDRDETVADAEDGSYMDLGGLVVKGAPNLELRLQVDEQSQSVTAVMLAGPDSALELRAFAAPRHDGIWDEVRADIAAEAAKHGGTATELDGEFGAELKLVVPVRTPDGKQATQTTRIVGVDGPRWLLRGTFLGKSASNPDPQGVVEQAFRDVIVVRGSDPMAPRDPIAMRMPASEEQVETTEGAEAEVDEDSAGRD